MITWMLSTWHIISVADRYLLKLNAARAEVTPVLRKLKQL